MCACGVWSFNSVDDSRYFITSTVHFFERSWQHVATIDVLCEIFRESGTKFQREEGLPEIPNVLLAQCRIGCRKPSCQRTRSIRPAVSIKHRLVTRCLHFTAGRTTGCITGWVNYANEPSQAALERSSQDAYDAVGLTRSKAAVWTCSRRCGVFDQNLKNS